MDGLEEIGLDFYPLLFTPLIPTARAVPSWVFFFFFFCQVAQAAINYLSNYIQESNKDASAHIPGSYPSGNENS